MGKRVDHDATQELSSSQIVPDARPPAYPGASKNDASMWMQAPVSADDFVGARKTKSGRRGSRAILVAVLSAIVVAGLGAGIWYAFLRESAAPNVAGAGTPTSADTPTPVEVPASVTPAVADPPADAAVAAATPDAAIVVDAAVAEVATVDADAISAAGKLFKKRPAKRPHKKRRRKKRKRAKRRR